MNMKRLPEMIQHKTAQFAEIDSEKRTATFVASDESVDSYGDIVRVAGWELERFKKNPVLLWGHKSSEPPIGTVPEVWKDGTRLMARAQFLDEGVSDMADRIWKIVKAGALRAVSVGFWPTKAPNDLKNEKNEWTGYEWIAQELMELSVVCVPANANALMAEARAAGMTDDMTRRWLGFDVDAKASDVAGFRANLAARMAVLSLGAARR
jgi:HK97 family phage prohead protease